MPPEPASHLVAAKKRYAQGMLPEAVAARELMDNPPTTGPISPTARRSDISGQVTLSNGQQVGRDMVDRVKARWTGAGVTGHGSDVALNQRGETPGSGNDAIRQLAIAKTGGMQAPDGGGQGIGAALLARRKGPAQRAIAANQL